MVIQTASIRTHNERRDNDLRTSNFLDIENHPTIAFKSTKIESAGADRYTMTGDLTIKGNTRPVSLAVTNYGEFNDPEGIGEDELREGRAGTEMRGVLFWVSLARKDKDVEPSAQLLQPQDVVVRQQDDATVRVLVGEGSPVELGTPGLILDVALPNGGSFSGPIPSDFNGFVYMLEGEASFGANRRRASRSQIAVLGPGGALTVEQARPGTRFLLMAGKPYDEKPIYNGPYVD